MAHLSFFIVFAYSFPLLTLLVAHCGDGERTLHAADFRKADIAIAVRPSVRPPGWPMHGRATYTVQQIIHSRAERSLLPLRAKDAVRAELSWA